MQETNLPAITEWLPIDAHRSYKLFKRLDGTIIYHVRGDKDNKIYVQADLDYAIKKAEDEL